MNSRRASERRGRRRRACSRPAPRDPGPPRPSRAGQPRGRRGLDLQRAGAPARGAGAAAGSGARRGRPAALCASWIWEGARGGGCAEGGGAVSAARAGGGGAAHSFLLRICAPRRPRPPPGLGSELGSATRPPSRGPRRGATSPPRGSGLFFSPGRTRALPLFWAVTPTHTSCLSGFENGGRRRRQPSPERLGFPTLPSPGLRLLTPRGLPPRLRCLRTVLPSLFALGRILLLNPPPIFFLFLFFFFFF